MSKHPYKTLPATAFWRRSVVEVDPARIDPAGEFRLSLSPATKVATAGSCFAQHIARYLRQAGLNYYVAEQAHPLIPPAIAEAHNYGLFSARFGNIYTARQLLQLMQRALGTFTPTDDAWIDRHGGTVDPFRPTTQPGGYLSADEMRADRRQHLSCVRRMFETLDVFVFTLGLTECWVSRQDGAVYPLCPGVEGGEFDDQRHAFYNQTVADVQADMDEFLGLLAGLNPRAEVVLTVSPVPLAATAVPGAHVLAATTYSKSVLRVAAGMLAASHPHVQYFPSYEIVTGAATRGRYFADDLRNVTEEGVAHVMRLFLERAGGRVSPPGMKVDPACPDRFHASMSRLVEVICDEAGLDQSAASM